MEKDNTRCKRGGSDLISSLPDPILHHILGLLKTKEAVQTCVLSKRWEHLWTSLPSLHFDHADFFPGQVLERDKHQRARMSAYGIEVLHCFINEAHFITFDRESEHQGYYKELEARYRRYVNFVNAVLLRRKPFPLDVFRVIDDSLYPEPWLMEVFQSFPEFLAHFNHVCGWILYGLKHKARVLHLPRFYLCYDYPYTSLEELYLYGYWDIGPWIVNLPRLRKLTVYKALCSDELKNLLSGSPILEYLWLDDCYGECVINHKCLKHLAIGHQKLLGITNYQLYVSAPNLLSFVYDGELSFLNSYKLTLNMPSLTSACLVVRDSSTIKCLNGMAAILPFFATVELLDLHFRCNWHKLTYAESRANTSESFDVSSKVTVPSCKNLEIIEVKPSRSDWMMGRLVYALIDGTKDDWYNLLSKYKNNTRPF